MQSTHGKTDASYVMGHPAGEEQRLQRLGLLQYLPTKRLFEQAGIMPGMKVLDVGSYDLYRMLVVEQHREPERYETWLAQLLVQHLLASASG